MSPAAVSGTDVRSRYAMSGTAYATAMPCPVLTYSVYQTTSYRLQSRGPPTRHPRACCSKMAVLDSSFQIPDSRPDFICGL
eukprot:2538612-Rhodomonas_salina.2